MKVLTIISHTEHYRTANGTIVGLGSTVTEINHLVTVFDEVRHIAMLHNSKAPASALPYTSSNVKFIPIAAVGGSSLFDKFGVLLQAPKVIVTLQKTLKQSNYFQFRAPTGIGVFVIPYLILFTSKKGWFKYAGNWKQNDAPLAYRIQRWLLQKQSRKVTINGFWDNQPSHCLSFENPCLTDEEVKLGQSIRLNKVFSYPIQLCFVGRLEAAKGLDIFIEAVSRLDKKDLLKIGKIHLVGDGQKIKAYKTKVEELNLPFIFHGFLSRNEVHEIYKQSHAIVLPSASEGFPKVIAEALNFGSIPIVSNISGISHYIKHKSNGLLLSTISVESVLTQLQHLINLTPEGFSNMLHLKSDNIERFTFSFYNHRIENELINENP